MPILEGYTNVEEIKNIAFEHGAKDFKTKQLNYFNKKDIDRWITSQ